ncbi:MAG: ribonucleotide reductase N-terminal alpha domain-containing protein, partial [Phycisphaerae bacterium]
MLTLSKDRLPTGDRDVAPPSRYDQYGQTENGLRVLRARYLEKDETGECLETPDDLFDRVAETISAIETCYGANESSRGEWKARFKRLLISRRFMPNSPTLMNAGRSMG